MADRRHEVALTPEEVHAILANCGTDSLLVGGQALAFWAGYFNVKRVAELSANVTSDVDFVGTAQTARKLGKALGWKVWLASMDDATAQTAKVTKLLPDGGVKQVDFLSAIIGLDTPRIQRRAVEVALPSGEIIRVLHPIDVLESRLRNIESLPEKRDATSVAQARLAVDVVASFLDSRLTAGAGTREILDAVERVAEIALDKGLARVTAHYGIDPLDAVPVSRIKNTAFQARRWPRIVATAQTLRRNAVAPRSDRKPK